jgi:hypothetical protein
VGNLISGALVMGYIVAALHFLKFWSRSGDRLFQLFALAFAIFAAQRLALVFLADDPDAHLFLYIARLIGFLIIIFAIVDKNRPAPA